KRWRRVRRSRLLPFCDAPSLYLELDACRRGSNGGRAIYTCEKVRARLSLVACGTRCVCDRCGPRQSSSLVSTSGRADLRGIGRTLVRLCTAQDTPAFGFEDPRMERRRRALRGCGSAVIRVRPRVL